MNTIIEKIKEKFLTKQFLSFGIIGAFNTVFCQVLYMGFVKLGIVPGISSMLADALGIVVSYFLNMKFTYHKEINWKSFVTFPLSYLPGLLISALIVMIVVDVFHGPELYAKLISLPIYIPINYLVMTFVVNRFSKK